MEGPEKRFALAGLDASLEGFSDTTRQEPRGSVRVDGPDVSLMQLSLISGLLCVSLTSFRRGKYRKAYRHEGRHPVKYKLAEEAGAVLAGDDALLRHGRHTTPFERVELLVPGEVLWLQLRGRGPYASIGGIASRLRQVVVVLAIVSAGVVAAAIRVGRCVTGI